VFYLSRALGGAEAALLSIDVEKRHVKTRGADTREGIEHELGLIKGLQLMLERLHAAELWRL
jgi:hypothetical protein